jgi:hypothetical protein
MTKSLLLFATTQAALEAEEALLDHGVEVDVVPAPPGSEKLCALALELPAGEVSRAQAILDARDIAFVHHSEQ